MIATVKKITKEDGETLFRVYAGKTCISSHFFTDEESQKKALGEAMEAAKRIEETTASEIIIYQTKEK